MYVYIMSNRSNSVLYTGVTNDLARRVYEHRHGTGTAFTARYSATKLVYHETFDDPQAAIEREKQIKGGSRAKKEALVNSTNPGWLDLYHDIEDGQF